ncbi:hypothetical protein CspHIS471_0501040 [Cutaneotrichosporon sp. HIS471]|nr:hypothetical protein CspHIS471_0501040 [Cutaneotrichosporon sp. HIS471]
MIISKVFFTLAASAVVTSATPTSLHSRQDRDYGTCKSNLVDGVKACVSCVGPDTTVPTDSRAIVDSWGGLMTTTCKEPEKTPYGKCNMCSKAVEDLAPFCHGQTAEQCAKACEKELLDPLKACSDCINTDNTATPDSVSLVRDWQSHMDTQCNALGGSCTDHCSAIRPDLEAQCGTSGASFSGCRDLCGRFDSASACVSCQQGLGGLPDLLGVAWGALQWYCQGGCGSTCMEVVNQVNSKCTDDAACWTAMCTGDSKSKLDECISCLPSAPIITSQRDELSGLSTIADICKGDKPGGTTCYDECTTILAKDKDLCQAGDNQKCKGMCTTENLDAMSNCNLCVNRPDFKDANGNKDLIGKYNTELNDWCKKNEKSDSSTVPSPPPASPPALPAPVGGGGGGGGGGGSGTGTRMTIGAPAGASSTGRATSTTAKPSSSAQAISIDHIGAALGFVAAILAFVAV